MIFAANRARYCDRHCRKRPKGQATRGCLNPEPRVYQLSLSKQLSPMSLSCNVSEIKRDIGRKSPILTYPASIWALRFGWPVGISPRFLAPENYRPRSIVRRCLRNPTFSLFDTVPACDGRTDGLTHDDSIYRATIVSRHKNSYGLPLCKISPL